VSVTGPHVYPCRVSTRFRVSDVPGDRPLVEKCGDPAAIARETAALRALRGRPWLPELVDEGPGRMVSTRLPGAPRALAAVAPEEAARLGAVLREVHESHRGATGGLWSWEAPARSLADYRRARARDTEEMLAGGADAGLARAALARCGAGDGGAEPFRLLHGDLVEANVVWGHAGPGLVDWEFSRMGDPAEDLAYLIELNGLSAAAAAAVGAGYGVAGMEARIAGWRPLVAADAGAWYLVQGMEPEGRALLRRARALVDASP
jgi:aminoglycoside phosphotransferase (APT) family kinase protein